MSPPPHPVRASRRMDDFSFNGQQDVVGGQKKKHHMMRHIWLFPLNFNDLPSLKKRTEWVTWVKKQKKRNTLN